MMSRPCFVLSTALALATGMPAAGVVEITPGNTILLPNAADQPVHFTISGDQPIWGVELFISLTGPDGATLPSFQITPEDTVGPVTGGVIAAGAGYVFDGALDFLDTVKSSGSTANLALLSFNVDGVDPNGRLLTLLVDTTGIFVGEFGIESHPGSGATNDVGDPLPLTVNAGRITVVPEPGAASTGLALAGLMVTRRRRGRAA